MQHKKLSDFMEHYPYVKPKCNTKHKEAPIYIRYNYNRVKRTLIPTGIYIHIKHWDFQKRKLRISCPDFEKTLNTIKEHNTKIANVLEYASRNFIEPTIEFVLTELAKNREYNFRQNTIDLFEQLEEYIKEKEKKVTPDVVKDYKSLKKHLLGFKEHSSQLIAFRNLNSTFYEEFKEYLTYDAVHPDKETKGLKNNSIGKQIKNLKAFVRDRIDKKIIPFIDLKPFKTITEDVDNIFLTEEELQKIYELDLSDNITLAEIRDIFIVGCYTGLRYSDLRNLSSVHININDELIELKQRKVHKSVVIPMIRYIPEILKKYNYNLPRYHMNDFNREIKEIGEKAGITQDREITNKKGNKIVTKRFPKNELISSHTCRRSFCTNMYLAGFPAEELMKISGHKSSRAFLTYIKIDSLQAALRLKQLFKNKYQDLNSVSNQTANLKVNTQGQKMILDESCIKSQLN